MPGATPTMGQTIGGGIAGVASTAESEGIKIYNERSKYNEWEFVYDFRKEQARQMAGQMGATGMQQQQGLGTNMGSGTGMGQGMGMGTGMTGMGTGMNTGTGTGFGQSGGFGSFGQQPQQQPPSTFGPIQQPQSPSPFGRSR